MAALRLSNLFWCSLFSSACWSPATSWRGTCARQQLNDYAGMVAYDIAGASADVSVHTLAEMIRRFGLVAPELVDPTQDAWPTASNSTPYFTVGVTMVEMELVDLTCKASVSTC